MYSLKPYHLKDRLLKKFVKKISIISFNKEYLVKPYKDIMIQNEIQKQNILESAAQLLKEKINKITSKKLPLKIKTTDLITGECEVPETLSKFYMQVITGQIIGVKTAKKLKDWLNHFLKILFMQYQMGE